MRTFLFIAAMISVAGGIGLWRARAPVLESTSEVSHRRAGNSVLKESASDLSVAMQAVLLSGDAPPERTRSIASITRGDSEYAELSEPPEEFVARAPVVDSEYLELSEPPVEMMRHSPPGTNQDSEYMVMSQPPLVHLQFEPNEESEYREVEIPEQGGSAPQSHR